MKLLSIFVFLTLLASVAKAEEFVFRDFNCKVLGPDDKIVKVTEGDKSESTCVIIGTEAMCHHKNQQTGKSQGQPTKFEVLDLDGVQVWSSAETGNVKMLIDEEAKRYQYGMTAIIVDRGTILSKQCVGTIVRHAE